MRLIGLTTLALALILACATSSHAADQRYVFSLKHGLSGAPVGATLPAYQRLFSRATLTSTQRYPPCTEINYAVSTSARRSGTPDVLLVSCQTVRRVDEVHLSGSAFCTSAGTCVRAPGSLAGIVRELGSTAHLQRHGECYMDVGTCSVVTSRHGPVMTSIRSSNCAQIRSLVQIPRRCTVSEVTFYRP